jgi:hypothetical protein
VKALELIDVWCRGKLSGNMQLSAFPGKFITRSTLWALPADPYLQSRPGQSGQTISLPLTVKYRFEFELMALF